MKLRNKKTGVIGELSGVNRIVVYEPNMPLCGNSILGEYDTLAGLNEEWEDYKEPLIKDEKIRKAVRAWAEANGISKLLVIKMAGRLEISDGSPHLIYISFRADEETMNNLNDRTYYTIEELCGEEEK